MRPLRSILCGLAVVCAVLSLVTPPATAQGAPLPTTTSEAIDQSVVSVNVMLENRGRVTRASGSGIIIDQSGLILTAAHVVTRATQIETKLRTGEVLASHLVGVDPVLDVALLRVDSRAVLPVVPLGSSAGLRRGDPVMVFGRAPARKNGPTSGEFVDVNLEVRPGVPYLVATAAAYPGDSGGALVNARGEVVGILGGISRDGTVSVSLAIDAVNAVYADLQAGTVHHAWIGVVGETVTDDLARQLDLPVRSGVLVLEVAENSPAAQAGLLGGQATGADAPPRGGDIIVGADGRPIRTFGELAAHVLSKHIGDAVNLELLRSGHTLTVTVILAERPTL